MAIAKDVSKEGQNAHTVTGWKCDHFKVKVRKKGSSRLILTFLVIWVSVMLTTALLALKFVFEFLQT
jgi:hypothetical protein